MSEMRAYHANTRKWGVVNADLFSGQGHISEHFGAFQSRFRSKVAKLPVSVKVGLKETRYKRPARNAIIMDTPVGCSRPCPQLRPEAPHIFQRSIFRLILSPATGPRPRMTYI